MTLSSSLIASAAALLLAISSGPTASPSPARSMIDGTWTPAAAQMGGQPFPEPVLKSMQLTVDGSHYVVSVGGQLDKGTIALDTTTSPMGMTVTGVEGPNAGRTYPAIFSLSGDTLRICYDLSGTARPTAFTSATGTMHFLAEYRRVVK
jgi:uncharacterized protein (TIGR03067 family)